MKSTSAVNLNNSTGCLWNGDAEGSANNQREIPGSDPSASQNAQILDALKAGEAISPQDALQRFGCFRLAARIGELKQQGFTVHSEMVDTGGKKVARYTHRPLGRGYNTLDFDVMIWAGNVHLVRDEIHAHWVMQSEEPRQRMWMLMEKPQQVRLKIDYRTDGDIRHPDKVRDTNGRTWDLSDDFRAYLTKVLRNAE